MSSRKTSKNRIVTDVIDKEIQNLSYLLESTFKLRLKKSLNLILKGEAVQKDVLCIEELDALSSTAKHLNNYLENLNLLIKGEVPQKVTNESLVGDYSVVRLLKEVPTIIGPDLIEYGPFKVDDIAVLPKEHVITLIEHHAAILIKKE